LEETERIRHEMEVARDAAMARVRLLEEGATTAGEGASAAEAERTEAIQRQREEIDRLTAELESAHEREAELQQALLDKATAQGESEEGIAATREELRIVVAAREAAEAELSAVRDELQATTDRLEVLAGEVETARAEAEHLRSQAGSGSKERVHLEQQLDDLRVSESEAKARVGKLDDELTVVRSERDQALRVQEEQQAALVSLRAAAATVAREREALHAQMASGEAALVQAADLQAALATEREAHERAQGDVARLEAELVEVRSAAVPVAGDSEELAGLRRDYEAVVAERDGALARLADLDGVTAVPELVSLDAEAVPVPEVMFAEEAVEDDTVTVISVPSEPTPHVDHPSEPVIAVIDASETWQDLEIEGHHVSVISPEADVAAIIGALDPVRVIANLSAGSLNSLGALRKAGCEARFWACVADVDQNYGVPIGVVEPVIPPLDPENVIRKLGDYATRGARIVTVGADVDALMSLRQALARKRVSVSMAWDAKQAIDLIQQMTPDALVIDLDLPKRDGYRIVTEAIVGLDPLPFTVLVGGRAKSGEAFVSALRERATTDVQLPLRELLATLAWSSEVPPSIDQRRKPKPTPFGSHGGRR
jgi:CheY-like chemotaxis protein